MSILAESNQISLRVRFVGKKIFFLLSYASCYSLLSMSDSLAPEETYISCLKSKFSYSAGDQSTTDDPTIFLLYLSHLQLILV